MLRICYLYALYMVKIWWRYGGDMWVIRAADNGRQREVRIREWLTGYGLLIKVTRCNNFYFQRCSQAYHAGCVSDGARQNVFAPALCTWPR
ncbi:MAG: hypothetical protein IKD78_08685 [Bacteroidales bacterium]|nr:hypothetical protein [Bacteroidales bacterium]